MRSLTKDEFDKIFKFYYEENGFSLESEEVKGRCCQCGRFLKDVKLSDGPEKEICCIDCLPTLLEELEHWE